MSRTGIESYFVVIDRGEQRDIFVGQYDDSAQHQEKLLANMKRRKNAAQPTLGRLYALAEFTGFEASMAREMISRLVRSSGWVKHGPTKRGDFDFLRVPPSTFHLGIRSITT